MTEGEIKRKGFFHLVPGQRYDESRSSALSGLLFYSFLMFTLPLLTFFGVQQVIENEFPDLGSPWSLLWPALASVAVVNVIIIFYVFKAFKEDQKEQDRQTVDEPSKKSQ